MERLELDLHDGRVWRPKRPERVFFAIMLDHDAGGQVSRFSSRFTSDMGLVGSSLPRERLHISLHRVGDYSVLPSKILYAAERAAEAVTLGPIDVVLDSIQTFAPPPGREDRKALVLLAKSDGLLRLFDHLGLAMARNGLRPARLFTPHVTLAYVRQSVALQAIELIRFTVREFALVHNPRGLQRPYKMLGRWRLGPGSMSSEPSLGSPRRIAARRDDKSHLPVRLDVVPNVRHRALRTTQGTASGTLESAMIGQNDSL